MTRRTTVIQPSTTTDALYTLANQPFKRRIVSASLYAFTQDSILLPTQPELKINDVEGNVLFTASVYTSQNAFNQHVSSMIFCDNTSGILASAINGTAVALSPGGVYYSAIIGNDCFVPASNLLTVTLYGSSPADTLPNLVLVTEDDDDNDYQA